MELFLKIVLSLITTLFFIYNFIVVVTTLSPTVTSILKTWEFRLPEGYNLLRFILSILLACFSVYLCIRLFGIVLNSNYIENIFFVLLNSITWLFGISIATIFVRISQVRSLREQLNIFKHTKDENLLVLKKVLNSKQSILLNDNIGNLSTKTYTDIDLFKKNSKNLDEENLDFLIKFLSPEEVLKIIEEHKPYVIVDDSNRKKLIDFTNRKKNDFPINIEYSNRYKGNNHKMVLVKFLKELFLLELYWR